MAKSKKRASDPTRIDPFDTDDSDVANRVIETPGKVAIRSRPKTWPLALSQVLPEGMVFAHAFGFVPRQGGRWRSGRCAHPDG
jgi:hypothetical protein